MADLREQVSPLLLCIVAFLLLHLLPQVLTGIPALGLGDVKLFFALAVALPPEDFFAVTVTAALTGGAVAAGMILRHDTERGVPYGTVTAFAAFLLLIDP